ncbi:MAG: [FeFe] hydrogenase H-cluster maturation GTPase HydF [Candidatus Omnitrophica bacterium 4484_213]|nr:MAG: [FeFe] hydrogenase H-cluster maturation GTPase HydF [Candidatus Omnitrophica bacterium 4484_213]
MRRTPKGLRLHIAIFGRRNVGKSSILNALTRQEVSIVSEIAGTTTDPVEKAMELLPIGPVLFIDTAGLDDIGALGEKRVAKTYKVFERADIILLVSQANVWGEYEEEILEEARRRKTPILVILNKTDLFKPEQDLGPVRSNPPLADAPNGHRGTSNGAKAKLNKEKIPYVETCALNQGWETAAKIKNELIKLLPSDWITPCPIIADLIEADDLIILVIPIDKEAPKGRIILPQQQTLREILDKKATALVVNERNLGKAISNLKQPPKIVVTDSQVFEQVFASTPLDIPVTSFSMLFARCKGDLKQLTEGAKRIDELNPGDKILIAEACTHHPIGDDIGRAKIPNWISERVGSKIGPAPDSQCRVNFDIYSGHDFPSNLKQYKLIVHCGACMLNRKEVLNRIYEAKSQGVPITNYGVAIAYLHNKLERALEPFEKKKRDENEKRLS